jgi:hypothetical protein
MQIPSTLFYNPTPSLFLVSTFYDSSILYSCYSFFFLSLDIKYEWEHVTFVFLILDYFTQHDDF